MIVIFHLDDQRNGERYTIKDQSHHQPRQESILDPRTMMESIRGSKIIDRISCIDHADPIRSRRSKISDCCPIGGNSQPG